MIDHEGGAAIRPVFVCGTGRSGTTIFTRMLGCHPAVWAFKWESQVFSGAPGLADLVLSGSGGRLLDAFSENVSGHLFRRRVRDHYEAGLFEIIDEAALGMHIGQLRAALSLPGGELAGAMGWLQGLLRRRRTPSPEREAVVLQACRAFADAIFLPPAIQAGAAIWCEKTPRNLLYADVIARLYPEALFIHVVRDGRDVVSSMLARSFWPVARSSRYPATAGFHGPVEFDRACGYWTTLVDIGLEHEEALGSGRWLNVRFEDFSTDVEGTFRKVWEFCGLSFSPAALEQMRQCVRPRSANTERWRRDLTDEQAQSLTAISEINLRRFAYL